MKKFYNAPESLVISLDAEDLITTSPYDEDLDQNGEEDIFEN